ncbi:MAG: D-alanine--D-alanine ligase B [Pelotomaculum sp. PtaB.Bin104]|nr:MAG: D-alanine--D-alanine ligase B [Pelotomaculum sp. PtaB.Bin104]
MSFNIGVLMGGRSAEREVSLRTGEAIDKALRAKGYQSVKIDVDLDIVEKIKAEKIGLAFLALHGRYGEDGMIQGLLEMLDIPYTGSGVLASAMVMDKIVAKKIMLFEGLATPQFILVGRKEFASLDLPAFLSKVSNEMGYPVVVKAPTQGSSIGISIVRQEKDLIPALQLSFQYDPVALIEQFIVGVEVTAAVLGNNEPAVLPLIEIRSSTGVYDYETKYTPGMSEHIIPPGITEEQQADVKNSAVRAFKALGCRGLARVDYIVDGQGRPYILELNTLPGMTATSLFPDAARAAGIEFPELVDKIVQLALEK